MSDPLDGVLFIHANDGELGREKNILISLREEKKTRHSVPSRQTL